MSRSGFRPAMYVASMSAQHGMSVYQPGTAIKTSETFDLISAEVMSRSLPRYVATNCVAVNWCVSPRYLT
jgi:hypothetical protein